MSMLYYISLLLLLTSFSIKTSQLSIIKSSSISKPTSSITSIASTALTITSTSTSTITSTWITLLAEFRGGKSNFRIDEFKDSLLYVLKINDYNFDNNLIEYIDDNIISVINDVETNNTIPLCAYIKLPSYEIAKELTIRCTLLRSISEIWGDGITLDEINKKSLNNYESLIAKHFHYGREELEKGEEIQDYHRQLNSWKVAFRRYGRGQNLDPAGNI